MTTMIETEKLKYAYPADEEGNMVFALRGVDLRIEKGTFVVVLGHNGSGKSTLAKTFNGVLLPAGGRVYVEGMDTCDPNLLLAIRQRVGMVFQNPDNQIVANVVEEDVAFAPENLGVPSEEIRKRVDDALAAVGMSEFATAMLDPVGRREVLGTIHRLNREKGITVVLITHHMNEAEEADRVVVMDDGQVAMDGSPQEVFTQVEALRSMGLTVPDTVDLLDRLQKDGLDVPLTALTVEQCADAIVQAMRGN